MVDSSNQEWVPTLVALFWRQGGYWQLATDY
jgi:hypothetical protein